MYPAKSENIQNNSPRPLPSIIFPAVAGEEYGLLGALVKMGPIAQTVHE